MFGNGFMNGFGMYPYPVYYVPVMIYPAYPMYPMMQPGPGPEMMPPMAPPFEEPPVDQEGPERPPMGPGICFGPDCPKGKIMRGEMEAPEPGNGPLCHGPLCPKSRL